MRSDEEDEEQEHDSAYVMFSPRNEVRFNVIELPTKKKKTKTLPEVALNALYAALPGTEDGWTRGLFRARFRLYSRGFGWYVFFLLAAQKAVGLSIIICVTLCHQNEIACSTSVTQD